MATISVCMIVKDEAENLGPCLDCLKDFVEEIIIVDTGSKDDTKEIARQYTDQVYDFLWTGNFSEARNFAFSLASMEYIYSADADERIDPKNQERFRLLKAALLPEVEIVQMRYANQLENGCVYNFDEEYRPKLFKRLRTFRWASPIHETIVTSPVIFDSDIIIGHFPKSPHGARDLAIFRRASDQNPLDSRLQHMYAMELYLAGELEDLLLARPYFENEIKSDKRTLDETAEARCILARAARLAGDTDSFYHTALLGVVGSPCAELCCEIGEFYLSRRAYEDAIPWFSHAIENAACLLVAKACGSWPMEGLAKCWDALGNPEQARYWKDSAKAWNPGMLEKNHSVR